ncbi:hypothetical protein [Mucilaginibacter aquariorum]|uniref:Uncharacterized protein n=1 Tax=Mucilaginibacter aquariorum TaxID=2967225 RepID=A0ABT1T4E9_9SPHI|nr:hypothetical protein [Mucilaginibacter aquariorum]MCQ6959392.1 hypothetical protein [Mucilaginibacter aquariorum]
MQQRIVVLKSNYFCISQDRYCLLPTKNCQLNNGIACGPGFPLIRAQALGARPVSAFIPNAEIPFVMLNIVKHLIANMQFR